VEASGAVDADEEDVLGLVARGPAGEHGAELDPGEAAVLAVRVAEAAGGGEQADHDERAHRQDEPLPPGAPPPPNPPAPPDHRTGSPSSRLMTSRWISLVPSPISRILASR